MQYTSAGREQIVAQLELILRSEQFRKSNRLRKFLSYVVEKTLESDETTIRSYNIAVEVFGKGSDFDPGDPYVRNIARLTRRALSNYYRDADSDVVVRIDVPAGNYVATFGPFNPAVANSGSLYGEPSIATASGWPDSDQSIIKAANDLIDDEHRPLKKIDGLSPSIAVIPFRYQGARTDSEMVIGEILASGVIAGLSKSSHVNVISWLSTTKFRDSDNSSYDVSSRLNCHYVVSGSYIARGERITMFVEISDCRTMEVIWADVIETVLPNLLSTQSDSIHHITMQTSRVVLNREFTRASTEPLESLSLHTRLIAGIHNTHSLSDKKFNQVKVDFDKILERYPNHTLVNAYMAQWYVLRINRGGGWRGVDRKEDKSKAIAHLEAALESNPAHSFALTMFGLVHTQFMRNPERGLELYNKAELYNPNEPILMAYKAAVLSYNEDSSNAILCAEKALTLSPFDPQLSMFHTCAAAAYYSAEDCESAEYHADLAFELNPVHTSNLRTLVAIQIDLGKFKEAKTSARRLLSIDPGFTTGSYLRKSPNAGYNAGRKIAQRLELAGVPSR